MDINTVLEELFEETKDTLELYEKNKARKLLQRKQMKKEKKQRNGFDYRNPGAYLTKRAKRTLKKDGHKANRVNINVVKALNGGYEDLPTSDKSLYYGNTIDYDRWLWMTT